MRDDCIDHGRAGGPQGYAHTREGAAPGQKVLMHRKAFFDDAGYLPPVVMHTCDNPRCINPEHLVAGDWDSNNKDRAAKGRSAQRNDARRKITDEQAAAIRLRYNPVRSCKPNPNGPTALAREFDVDTGVIYNIIKGRSHFAS